MLNDAQALLKLLQLVSPALPVGAYSYSEGLETLTQTGQIANATTLEHWLVQELRYGAIAVEGALLANAYRSIADDQELRRTNDWLSAFRETEELRSQSWQMGRSLARLLVELDPTIASSLAAIDEPLNFAIGFAIAAAHWQIDLTSAIVGYLHSWAINLINAGVRLIPLGQTQGQQLLLKLSAEIEQTAERVTTFIKNSERTLAENDTENHPDNYFENDTENHPNNYFDNVNNYINNYVNNYFEDYAETCSWGLAIASMNHEALYSRLFRS